MIILIGKYHINTRNIDYVHKSKSDTLCKSESTGMWMESFVFDESNVTGIVLTINFSSENSIGLYHTDAEKFLEVYDEYFEIIDANTVEITSR